MVRFLRRLIKPAWRRPYHLVLAWLAAWRYGFPSRRLVVIGVTGTDGKTTTATMIAAALQAGGIKTGLSSTVWYQIDDQRWLNESHMTMPGRFQLQQLLRRMVDAGCHAAVIEASSEGLRQGRLQGISVDVAVLTNISPEHIESHGSFAAYRAAKKILFAAVSMADAKTVDGRPAPRVCVVNGDDPEAKFFLDVDAPKKVLTSIQDSVSGMYGAEVVRATDILVDQTGSTWTVDGQRVCVNIPGRYNVANALQAMAVARTLGVALNDAARGIAGVTSLPGRGERIDLKNGASVMIDYAVTPAALRSLYASLKEAGAARIIAVFGAAGGGRDHWKRPELGKIASEFAASIILTSEDPFDESPAAIADDIRQGIDNGVPTEVIVDRKAAIASAIQMAQPGDVIALTGMGSETTMNVAGGQKVAWSDRAIVESLVA